MSNLVANNVQNMKSMFEYCIRLRNLVFPKIFDVSNVVDTSFMFMNVRILSSLDLSKGIKLEMENMKSMSSGMTILKKLNLSLLNPEKLIYMDHAFDVCISLISLSFPLLKLHL